MIEHSALFPPTESTYALHELIHCCDQIEDLFMFERMNIHLKHMIQNKSCPMILIVTTYAKEEFIKQTVAYNLSRSSKLIETLSFMPSNYNIVKKILFSFSNIRYDAVEKVIYSLPTCRVHELREVT